MTTKLAFPPLKRLRICGWIAACAMTATAFAAQAPTSRIPSEINNSEVSQLKTSLQPLAQAQLDAGRMPSETRLNGISIVFNRSAAQQADLEALIAAQQNPASPLYHQWLNPEQFAARFGMAQSDIDKVESWLQQQGFSIDSIARSRNMIRFSGSVGQVEQAFQTQMHYYKVDGVQHFAPSTVLSVPAAIAPAVAGVRNLNDFRPRPMVRRTPPQLANPRPNFTSSTSGLHYMTPGDVATIYDIKPAYSAGNTGAGQSIAVIGQSQISVSDIENFQTAAGLTVKDPTLVLVPGSGASVVSTGDESESDLDLEYAGGIAKGATVYLVYVGSDNNFSVFDSLQFAVDTKIASIVSLSYGACETLFSASDYTTLESVAQQGAAQGQSIVVSSGDEGSTGCFGTTGTSLTTTQLEALAVNYPASSAYVTAVGGTEFPLADVQASNTTYWTASSGSDVISSALSYIPEQVWNDDSSTDSTQPLSASGGGTSALTARPTWQTGVPGIPSGTHRLIPDVSLASSPGYVNSSGTYLGGGYLYCSSDTTATGVTGSCTSGNGFRDANNQFLTVAGGTSFAAPIFAGMLAVLNQEKGYTTGQGLVNKNLYTMAANSATYASAFHDITTGSNKCTAGSTFCSTAGASQYAATTGYDEATGLGSVDFANLATAWSANTSALIGTTTTLSAASGTPNVNTADTITITVSAASGSATPTGTVTLEIDGGTGFGGTNVAAQTLSSNGTVTYSASFATAGVHDVVALYSGDATHATSTGIVSVTVSGTSSGTGTFTLSGTNVTVSRGRAASSTITVTPKNGYTGTVFLTFTTSNNSALTNLCFDFTNTLSNGDGSVTVSSATTAVTTQLQFDTKASDCVTSGAVKAGGHPMYRLRSISTSRNTGPNPAPAALAFAGLLLVGFLGRRSRKLSALAAVLVLASIGLALTACGGVTSTVSNPPKGTYTITLTGTDSNTSTVTAQTTFTLTID